MGLLALDIEANLLDQWAADYTVFLVQWDDGHGDRGCWREGEPLDAIHAVLGRHKALVGANFSYDIHGLREGLGIDLLTSGHRLHDVQTLARVVIPGRFTYTLESLGTDLLGADSTQGQRDLAAAAKAHGLRWVKADKDYYGLWKLEPELMVRYGMEDVALTIALWNLLWKRMAPSDNEVYRMEITGVAPILRRAEAWGARVDKDALAELRAALEDERDELHFKLLAQGLTEEALGHDATEDEERTPASSKALLRDLLAAGVPLYRKTPKSGQVNPKTGKRAPDQLAVNKDALKEFKRAHPVVADLLAWRSRNTILRTFVRAMEKANPRIHTSFRQAEARTSRMSSAKPNMQNLPRVDKDSPEMTEAEMRLALGVRSVIVPEPGNALLVCDYDSIEVRVLAHYLAEPELTRLLDDGMDFHTRTASKVYHGRYEDFDKGGPNDAKRTDAKTTTFRTIYGGGAALTARQLGITTVEAAALIADIKGAIPGYHELESKIKRRVNSRSWPHINTLLGRRLFVPKDYVGLNTLIQGSSAELMKLGMIAAAPVLAPFGYNIILVVHDELVAEGPAACADEALAAMISAMESAFTLSPRLKATGSWSTVSYAKAK